MMPARQNGFQNRDGPYKMTDVIQCPSEAIAASEFAPLLAFWQI